MIRLIAVRENNVSRHDGGPIKGTLKPFKTIVLCCTGSFRGAHNWSPMVPRDASLLDSYKSDRYFPSLYDILHTINKTRASLAARVTAVDLIAITVCVRYIGLIYATRYMRDSQGIPINKLPSKRCKYTEETMFPFPFTLNGI